MNVLDNYFDEDLIPDYCTKRKLEKFYSYYLKNLHASPYKMKWLTVKDINYDEPKSWKCIGDKYLEDSENDKNKLAIDIYENGTYFPIFVFRQSDGTYNLRDGIHRIICFKNLIKKGLWNKDKKILVSTDEIVENYSEGKQLTYYLPLVVKDEFKENYIFMYKDLYSNTPLEYADKEKEFAIYRSTSKGYLASTCISLLLRNAFFEYKKKYGAPIKPSPIINNYEQWKKWRGY